MKFLLISLCIILQMQKANCQSLSITEYGRVAFINPYDTIEMKKRIDLALICNYFITKFYPKNKHIVYLMFRNTTDSSEYNVCFDNIFGNSLDEDNGSRALKYYKPGLRIESSYDSITLLKLLDYGLSNIKHLYKKREHMLSKNSIESENLRLPKSEVKILLSKPPNKRLIKFLSL